MSDVKTEIRVNQEFSGVRTVQNFCIVHTSFEFARYIVTEDYAVTGGVVAPTNQPTLLTFTSVTSSSYTVSWTASVGGADVYLAIRRTSASPTYVPVDGTNYNVGDTVGDGEVRHFGAGVTFDESGLSSSTEYFYDIFAGNGATGTWVYLTTSPLEGSQATLFNFVSAIRLNGANQFMRKTSVTTFNGVTDLDVAGWFKIDSGVTGNQDIIQALDASVNGFYIRVISISGGYGKLTFAVGAPANNNTATMPTAIVPIDGTKHFFVFRFTGGGASNALRLIMKFDDTTITPTFTGTIPSSIGSVTRTLKLGTNIAESLFMKGVADHFAMNVGAHWSDANDTTHYGAGLGANYVSGTNVWLMNEGTGITAADSGSVAGLDLSLINTPTWEAF